jgi:hypothetical protein
VSGVDADSPAACARFREALARDDGAARGRLFSAHLRECSDCATEAERFLATADIVRAEASNYAHPTSFVSDLLGAIERGAPSEPPSSHRRGPALTAHEPASSRSA